MEVVELTLLNDDDEVFCCPDELGLVAFDTCCMISRNTRSVLSTFSDRRSTFSLESLYFSSSASLPSLFASSNSFSFVCSARWHRWIED